MKRLPQIGISVWMESDVFTGIGTVIDIYSVGQAAEITIRDDKGRCWTSKKESLRVIPVICEECFHTHEDCACAEDDGTPIR
jgi:hypothetical protein